MRGTPRDDPVDPEIGHSPAIPATALSPTTPQMDLPEVAVSAPAPTDYGGGHDFKSDTTKPTSEVEPWQTNARDSVLAQQGQQTVRQGQWLRQIKLTVYAQEGAKDQSSGLDLSQMRINFSVHKQIASSSPNILKAKIYNLSRPPGPDTVGKVKQYHRVQLACGYLGEGNLTMIFDGTVMLYVVGKDNPTDSYIEIIAGDADQNLNHGVAALNWPAGSTPSQRTKDMLQAGGYKVGEVQEVKGEQKAIRAVSYIGMVDKGIRNNTNATLSDFWVDDGKAYVIPWNGYRKGEMVILNPQTGLLGIPKVTPNGIEAQCLLNPKLRLGGLVQIDSDLLSGVPFIPGEENPFAQYPIPLPGGGPGFAYGAAATSPTGIYKIMLLNHFGDTRGNEWYSEIVGAAAGKDGNTLSGTYLGTAFDRTGGNNPPGSA